MSEHAEITDAAQVVALTPEAAEQIKHLRAKEENPDRKVFRVYVESGGCSGLKYGMVFDEQREKDVFSEQFGVPMVVDSFSADYLKGSHIDFSDSLNDGGFKIINPNARQSCGCGSSFEA